MAYIVAVWRLDLTADGLSYEDEVFGPFRESERADRKAAQIEKALKRRGVEEWGVSVTECFSGSYAAREIAEWMEEKNDRRSSIRSRA